MNVSHPQIQINILGVRKGKQLKSQAKLNMAQSYSNLKWETQATDLYDKV